MPAIVVVATSPSKEAAHGNAAQAGVMDVQLVGLDEKKLEVLLIYQQHFKDRQNPREFSFSANCPSAHSRQVSASSVAPRCFA